jgi:ribonuclease HI
VELSNRIIQFLYNAKDMKTLKLEHTLAELVQKGEKTSTLRIYDDKDLRVDDEVQFIDKVDPHDRSTWVPIGVGRINEVIEKRLDALTAADLEGHEQYESQAELLETFRGFYGSEVNESTPVKVVRFSFTPITFTEAVQNQAPAKVKEVKLFADGGSRGNPGPSASGYVLFDMDDNKLFEQGVYLGVTTNNQAEYLALKLGLEQALKSGVRIVHVYMDSLLVVNQMIGKFKVKNRDLWPIHDAIKKLLPQFEKVLFTHVPRALNKDADAMVNDALDTEAKNNLPV